jgi:flagellin-specific chaperone FliS
MVKIRVIVSHPEKEKLIIKGNDKFRLKNCLNYNKGNYLTNKFFTIYVYGIEEKKDITIYEE